MFKGLVFLPLLIATTVIAFYLSNYILSPYKPDMSLNEGNVALLLSIFGVALTMALAFIISLIDKIFFKKFYEQPNLKLAIKYSVIFSAIVIINLYLKMLDDWSFVVLSISSLLFILVLLTDYFESKKNSMEENDNEKEME